jgi:nitroreductase
VTIERYAGEPEFKPTSTDVLTAIRERRSIRKYTEEAISEEELNTILHAGLCAPTARNRRPFHFIVIKDRERLTTLAQGKIHARMLSSAACGLVICGDTALEERPEHFYADCFAATQNMLLAIHGLGLGGVWLGVTKDSEWYQLIRETLELPEQIEPAAVIAVGHPAEERPRPQTWEEDRIHYEKW